MESTQQNRRKQIARHNRTIFLNVVMLLAFLVFFTWLLSSGTDSTFREALLPLTIMAGVSIGSVFIHTIVHEIGHITAGSLVKFHVRSIQIWRFELFYNCKKWRLLFINSMVIPLRLRLLLSGSTSFVTSDLNNLTRRMVILLAGGPIASTILLFIMVGGLAVYNRLPIPSVVIAPMAFTFIFISFGAVFNAIFPQVLNNANSDGFQIRTLMSGGEEAMRLAAAQITFTDNRTGIHPRDWNYALLNQAVAGQCRSPQHCILLDLACTAALSHQDFDLADTYMDAIQEYIDPDDPKFDPADINDVLKHAIYLDIAFHEAFYRSDLVESRRWFEQATKQEALKHGWARVEAAILLADGQCQEAIDKAKAGKYELERDKYFSGVHFWVNEELDALIDRANERAKSA